MINTYHDDFVNSEGSSVFGARHFGINIVSHKNDLSDDSPFRTAVDSLSPSSLRYPGGTVTEDYFDPRSSFFERIFEDNETETVEYLNGDQVTTVRSIMKYAAEENKTIDFVLPTEHLLKEGPTGERVIDDLAVRKLMKKVDGLIQGNYGDARIAIFEIGNEYFVENRMTAEEYGEIANRMAIELGDAYDRYRLAHPFDRNWVEPKIAVQSGAGWLTEDNATIIDSLSAEARSEIDIVVGHYYPRDLEAVEKFDRFYQNLHQWQKTPGLESTKIWLSEWNIQDSVASDHGIYQASSFIAAFHEMGEQGVDLATVWGIQHRNVDSSLLRLENGPLQVDGSRPAVTDLTATGFVFQQMALDLCGLKSLDLAEQNFVATHDINDIDIQAFGNENRAVVYISSRSDAPTTVKLDAEHYFEGSKHISATHITPIDDLRTPDIDESSPDSHDAHIAVHGVSYDHLKMNGGYVTLQPGEILQLDISFENSGVLLDGYRPLDPVPGNHYSDHFVGSALEDQLRGFEGDDTIQGRGGRDIITGGNGNDHLSGGLQNDLIFGGADSDTLFGGDGHDAILGNGGNDKAFGGAGDDRLDGGDGNDNLHGGLGNDTLVSFAGDNTLFGEEGSDLFITSANANTSITDFDYSSGDRLSFVWFYKNEENLKSQASVIDNFESGVSDIVITHGTGFTTTLVGAGDQQDLLGDFNIDQGDSDQSALALAKTLNALNSSQIASLISSYDTSDFEQQIMGVNSNALLLNLKGTQAGAFLNALLSDEADDFYAQISDATFSKFVQGLGADGLLSFVTELDMEQLDHFTNVIPDDALTHINDTIEAVEEDQVAEVDHGNHLTPEPDDNPIDHLPEIPVQEDYPPKELDGEEVEPAFVADVSPCFVATAAYCDRLHPDVVSFRLYRERVLRKSAVGIKFIDLYWRIGPKLAVPVNRSILLQKISRAILKSLLRLLQRRYGVNFDRRFPT